MLDDDKDNVEDLLMGSTKARRSLPIYMKKSSVTKSRYASMQLRQHLKAK